MVRLAGELGGSLSRGDSHRQDPSAWRSRWLVFKVDCLSSARGPTGQGQRKRAWHWIAFAIDVEVHNTIDRCLTIPPQNAEWEAVLSGMHIRKGRVL